LSENFKTSNYFSEKAIQYLRNTSNINPKDIKTIAEVCEIETNTAYRAHFNSVALENK
jgi:hypothetical protein